jgi:hypothetical protein
MGVILNLLSPDMATIRPMVELSPMAKTMPVQVPCVTKVDESARLRVSKGLSDVDVRLPAMGSLERRVSDVYARAKEEYLSPVRSERSNLRSEDVSKIRKSAGTRSPIDRSTTSPTTRSAALMTWRAPPRTTVASWATRALMDFMTRDAWKSTRE